MIKQKLGSNLSKGNSLNPTCFNTKWACTWSLPDLNQLGLKVDKNLEFSITAKNKDNQDFISGLIKELYSTDKISQYDATYFGGFDRYSIEKDWRETAGTLLFIGIFLSVIFLLATVLVDLLQADFRRAMRDQENFVILQQVGLDQKQTSTTIRKQILTVFSFLYFSPSST